MWCSSAYQVTGSAVVFCTAPGSSSSTVGGSFVLSSQMRSIPLGGGNATDTTVAHRLQACETYGLDYWAPYQAAWIALVLVIATGRTVIKRFLTHQAA